MEQLVFSAKSLGSAIKRQRKAKMLTQKEGGIPFKLDQTTVSSIEQGAPGTRSGQPAHARVGRVG